ncbi:MAG: hypothetical protein IPQ13_11715 [Holophagaceae bacterium]|nr:hypothetical protein [Holophagaceae bacterium]
MRFHPTTFPTMMIIVVGASLPGAPLLLAPAPKITTAEIRQLRIFEEPLIPVGSEIIQAENLELHDAVLSYQKGGDAEDLRPFQSFLKAHPASVWAPSLWCNLGITYSRFGYISKALDAWEHAWALSKNVRSGEMRAIPERAAGGLADLYARLGRVSELENLLSELDRSPALHGAAADRVIAARSGLGFMKAEPTKAFLCGPLSLACILTSLGRDSAPAHEASCTPKGTSLTHNLDLATRLGLNMQMAKREPGAEMLIPALVHWKAGHFASIVKHQNGRYLVEDPNSTKETWISEDALDDEASGGMLVPAGPLPPGWQPLPERDGDAVWGCGYVTIPCDAPDPTDPGFTECPTGGPGMATYSFHAQSTSLMLKDTPLAYTPPRGPALPFTLTYAQRQANQPQAFSYSNLGPKWTFSFLAYIEDVVPSAPAKTPLNGLMLRRGSEGSQTPASPPVALSGSAQNGLEMKEAMLLLGPHISGGGGGASYAAPFLFGSFGELKVYRFDTRTYRGSSASRPQQQNQTTLIRPTPNSYERIGLDGTRQVFDLPTSTAPGYRKIFLTKLIDKSGNTVTINYDAQMRVASLTDALGQVTTLGYELIADPLKITKVTDPFGRSASFEYNDQGQLARITDVIGLASEFTYGPTASSPAAAADFINSMKTPYGTTRFDIAEQYMVRALTATDPLGSMERIESRSSSTVPYSESVVPPNVGNAHLNFRNTFYWNKRAMAQAPGDYTQAELIHWLHSDANGAATIAIPESRKKVGESRIWYRYQDQASSYLAGAFGLPSRTTRLLPDGTSQETLATYTPGGRMDTSTDPLGRVTKYIYSQPDEEDLLEVRNITGGASEILSKTTYDGNHRPLTVTDAASQVTTYTYNATGQVATITNPKGETTTFSYGGSGYLSSITGALAGSTTTFTYDTAGRVHTATGPDGLSIATDYDDLNRPTKVTYPDGTYEQTLYDKLDVSAKRDRKGRWTTLQYNPLRQLVEVQDPQGRITHLDWCGCGNQLEGLTDPSGHSTAWIRDLNGKVTAKILNDHTQTNYGYDSAGRLAHRLDAKGHQTVYSYWTDGSLQRVDYPDAMGTTPSVNYAYDPKYPRLATMTDGIGTTTYDYYPINGTVGAGRLKTVVGPFPNSTITYTYDQLGRVTVRDINGSAETRNFDALGRLGTVVNPLGTFTYNYDGLTSRLSRVDYPNGQKTVFTYEDSLKDFRLKTIQNLKSDNSNISTFGYTYDTDGQIKTWSQAADAAAPKTYTFDYDAANQLTSAILNGPNGELIRQYSYGYDLAGNRTSEGVDGATTTATHNDVNQLTGQRYSLNDAALRRKDADDAAQAQRRQASRIAKPTRPSKAPKASEPKNNSSQPTRN